MPRANGTVFTFTYLGHRSGREFEISLPAKFVVCGRCDGKGAHVNPSIDGNGLTREDFDEDPDFAESYFAGDYDVTCDTCHGERVVAEVEPERFTRRQRILWEAHQKAEQEYQRDYASERWLRMAESGERW